MEQAFVEFDELPDRLRLHRAGASRSAAGRAGSRGQGAAPGRGEPDRGRPRAPLPGREAAQGACPRARVHRPAGARRRVRALDPARARLRPRGPQRGGVPPQLRRRPGRRRAARDQAVLDRAHPHARVPARHEGLGARPRRDGAVPAPRHRLPDGGHVDDDGLPPGLLPLRPAPGEHLRPRVGRARPRRLRAGREAHRRGHDEAHAPLRRRGDGERGRDPAAAARARRALRARARAGVPRRDPDPLRPLLRDAALGHRPDAGDPRGVPAHLLAQPAPSRRAS